MAIGVVPRVAERRGLSQLEELFRDHYELVYRTAYSIVNNTADAEDVLQTVFLRLVRRQVPPDFTTNVKGYFYRSAVNVSLDTIRSRRRYDLVMPARLRLRLRTPGDRRAAHPGPTSLSSACWSRSGSS